MQILVGYVEKSNMIFYFFPKALTAMGTELSPSNGVVGTSGISQ
jgi:hypothetical protein